MATRTVGFGKTHATVGAGITAATDGVDTVEVFEEDAFGGRDYVFEGRIVTAKGLTIKSDTVGKRIYFAAFNFTSGTTTITLQDFHFVGNKNGGPTIETTGARTVLMERIIIQCDGFRPFAPGGAGSTQIFNNIIIIGCSGEAFLIGNGTCTFNYCVAVFCPTGFARFAPSTCTANNCLAYACGTDWTGTWSGKNNASTESSGVPGSNPVHDITQAKAGFAYHGTQFPNDFRAIEADMAAGGIKDAGDPVSGVTTDIDGRTRDVTTPNIGASEDFPGFGPVTPDPPKPDGVVVSDPTTDGDLTITWSNSGSYASGDVIMAHDKDDSNAILGGGDATTGTMRISNLTNNQQKNILLRAVRP